MRLPYREEIIESLNPVKSSEPEEIWDYKEFLSSVDDDREFAKKIIGDFIAQSERIIGEIETNLNTLLEADVIHKLAHTIKGSSGAIYANALFKAAKNLDEEAKKAGSIELAAKLNPNELKEEFEKFRKYSAEAIATF